MIDRARHALAPLVAALVLAVLGVGLLSLPATAVVEPPAPAPARTDPPPPGRAATPIGYDVSWPQCGLTLPTGQAFAVVGVNGGLANTTNPCFAEQLAWAGTSTGTTDQPAAALYLNTANPGRLASWWPTSNYYPEDASAQVANPYGVCRPGDYGAACAYMYGFAKAYDSATIRGVRDPADYFWWLDVETMNSWEGDDRSNRAVLEGMTYYLTNVLRSEGVGIYSTTYQWSRIVGSVGPVTSDTLVPGPSSLNGLPSWIAGATSLRTAQRACDGIPLTGGEIAMVQWVENDLDHNIACDAS